MTETRTREEGIEALRRVLKLSAEVPDDQVIAEAADRLEEGMDRPRPPETHGPAKPPRESPEIGG